jgi:hypothetical protein
MAMIVIVRAFVPVIGREWLRVIVSIGVRAIVRMGTQVGTQVGTRVGMRVIVRMVGVIVAALVRMVMRVVCPRLGLEAVVDRLDLEAHAAQHVGQHVIGLETQALAAQIHGDVAVAEVIRGACQAAVVPTRSHRHQRLRRRAHDDQHTVGVHQHIAITHHGAARQEDGHAAGASTPFASAAASGDQNRK